MEEIMLSKSYFWSVPALCNISFCISNKSVCQSVFSSIAEDMYKNSSLKIFWAVVQVFVSDRNDYETHSSKKIDKNFHIGEWEVKIYEIGKIENGKKKEIFSQKFEIVN